MSDNPDDDNANAAATSGLNLSPEQQAEVGKLMARARAQGRSSAERKQNAADPAANIAATVAATVAEAFARFGIGAQPAQQDHVRAPVAAPLAPSKNLSTLTGLVDVFSLAPADIDSMNPSQIRGHYEQALAAGRSQSGAPNRPKPGKR